MKTTQERFQTKVLAVENGCHEWIGAKTGKGYGNFWVDGRTVRAPRYAYEDRFGPITHGMQLDHLCRNRACVNPDHLEVVTSQENTRRGVAPAALNVTKTHCPKGHPYDDLNTLRAGKRRRCRECRHEQNRRSRQNHPETRREQNKRYWERRKERPS